MTKSPSPDINKNNGKIISSAFIVINLKFFVFIVKIPAFFQCILYINIKRHIAQHDTILYNVSMKTPSLGERIAEIRKTYSLSIDVLAERSGVPAALISKIENDGLIPDLAPLIKIARGLGVRLGTLLDDHEQLGPVISRAGGTAEGSRFKTGLPEGADASAGHHGMSFNALAADKNGRHMEPFIVTIQSDAQQDKSAHEGEEFIYVLEGTLALDYGTDKETLKTGDSVYYDSIVPHRVYSANSEPVRILAVIYTPV
jgi:transcriptional regulator with XRE-family HTH domain